MITEVSHVSLCLPFCNIYKVSAAVGITCINSINGQIIFRNLRNIKTGSIVTILKYSVSVWGDERLLYSLMEDIRKKTFFYIVQKWPRAARP